MFNITLLFFFFFLFRVSRVRIKHCEERKHPKISHKPKLTRWRPETISSAILVQLRYLILSKSHCEIMFYATAKRNSKNLLNIFSRYHFFYGYISFISSSPGTYNFMKNFCIYATFIPYFSAWPFFNGLNSQRNKGDLNIQFRNRKFFQYRENCAGYRMNGNQDIRRIRRTLHSTGKKKRVKER